MYAGFGPVVTGHQVEFRLFFPDRSVDPGQYTRGGLPHIATIRVTGTFQSQLGGVDWDYEHAPEMVREPHPHGMLYRFVVPQPLPDGYYEYKFFVTFENGTRRWCGDPCTKYGGGELENSAFVVGGPDVQLQPFAERRPQPDLVLYELMLDDFTAEFRGDLAPVDAARLKIPHLLELGVNAVEFMPWTAWPGGGFNWGYEPFQFFAVEYRYVHDPADPTDRLHRLKQLIKALHDHHLNVIMDGVFNHATAGPEPGRGFAYYWLYQNPVESPFVGDFAAHGYFLDLDFGNACTQQFIRDVCQYWFDEYQIDGIRFDYTIGFFERGGLGRGIRQLCADLVQYCNDTGRANVSLMLEHLTDNRYQAIDDTNQTEATGCWFDRMLFETWDYLASGNLDERIMRILNTAKDFAQGKGPITYLENHDHTSLVDKAGGRQVWWKMQPYLIALFTTSGAVLVHNGQEFAEDYAMSEDGPGRVQPRPLHWANSSDPIGQSLQHLFRTLIDIRSASPALRGPFFYPERYEPFFNDQGYGLDTSKDVVIYHRWADKPEGGLQRFIVVLNCSAYDQWVDIPFSVDGEWRDVLNDRSDQVTGFWLRNQRITSNWGRVYTIDTP